MFEKPADQRAVILATIVAVASFAAGLHAQAPPGNGWIGLGVTCTDCLLRHDSSRREWSFSQPPVVADLTPGGPAAKAGLSVGDTITSIDGVATTSALGGLRFANLHVGQTVRFEFTHGSHTGIVDVTPEPVRSTIGLRSTADSGSAPARPGRRAADNGRQGSAPADSAFRIGHPQFTGIVPGGLVEAYGSNVVVTTKGANGGLTITGDHVLVVVTPIPDRGNHSP